VAHEFEIPVSELDAGGKDYTFILPVAWMRKALEDIEAKTTGKDGALSVRVSKSMGDIAVHGTLTAELEAPCGRCLKPARVPIHQRVAVMFAPKPARTPKTEYEFGPDEADVLPYEGETLVLDDLVRDELVLEIPMIPLCSADCQGIAPPPPPEESAPADHVDPRLAPLLKLKVASNKKKNKE
jgi:uncharacterized protein